jgi:hypothetical protein
MKFYDDITYFLRVDLELYPMQVYLAIRKAPVAEINR